MKRLLQTFAAIAMTALLAAPAQAAPQSMDEERLDYLVRLLIEEGPEAVDRFMSPEPDGSTAYGDYDYYSYAAARGGSYKASSGRGSGASGRSRTKEIDVLSYSWGEVKSRSDDVAFALLYAAIVENDPLAEFYLNHPDAEGAADYGDFTYYSYTGRWRIGPYYRNGQRCWQWGHTIVCRSRGIP